MTTEDLPYRQSNSWESKLERMYDLPSDLPRLRTLRTWHAMWVDRIDQAITTAERQKREQQQGEERRPPPPDWTLELGIGVGAPPTDVHTGDCYATAAGGAPSPANKPWPRSPKASGPASTAAPTPPSACSNRASSAPLPCGSPRQSRPRPSRRCLTRRAGLVVRAQVRRSPDHPPPCCRDSDPLCQIRQGRHPALDGHRARRHAAPARNRPRRRSSHLEERAPGLRGRPIPGRVQPRPSPSTRRPAPRRIRRLGHPPPPRP